MKFTLVPLLLGSALLSGCVSSSPSTPTASPAVSSVIISSSPSPMNTLQKPLPSPTDEIAVVQTTKGKIVLRFFPEEAPKSVQNFLGLAKKEYYNGVIFHRVIEGFMIQGGDPTGTGRGGESFFGGQFENEPSEKVSNKRGSIAMANAGGNATNGSQFFINVKDNTFLDGYANGKKKDCSIRGVSCHTVFGEVIEGMDVVDAIVASKTDSQDKPVETIQMEKVEIIPYSQYQK